MSNIWGISANGNTSGLQPEIESSILSISTKQSQCRQVACHSLWERDFECSIHSTETKQLRYSVTAAPLPLTELV